MKGRIENELKIEKSINNVLSALPSYAEEWYYNLRASNKQPSSCLDFLNKLKRFLAFINDDIKNIKPEQLTLLSIEKYFINIQTKNGKDGQRTHTSGSYQYSTWCALHNFFDFMTNRNYIRKNYVECIRRPKNNDLQRINQNRIMLTKDDFVKILDSVNNGSGSNIAKNRQKKYKSRDISIILLFMTTGMRREALAEINIEDVDLKNKTLLVVDKGMKEHKYVLNDMVVNNIIEWIEVRKEITSNNDALFISGNGKRMTGSALYKLVKKYCDDALGYAVSPHKLRSGFCSILYEMKGDIEFVRRVVGHSNIATTQRYIVTSNDERREAANMISGLF